MKSFGKSLIYDLHYLLQLLRKEKEVTYSLFSTSLQNGPPIHCLYFFVDKFQEEEISKNNALVEQHAQQEIDIKKQVN